MPALKLAFWRGKRRLKSGFTQQKCPQNTVESTQVGKNENMTHRLHLTLSFQEPQWNIQSKTKALASLKVCKYAHNKINFSEIIPVDLFFRSSAGSKSQRGQVIRGWSVPATFLEPGTNKLYSKLVHVKPHILDWFCQTTVESAWRALRYVWEYLQRLTDRQPWATTAKARHGGSG